MYGAFSKLFRIGIWLFDFPFVVFFVLSRFCLSVIGVLWRTFSFRGFCQLGYLGSTNWEPPTRNTTTPVSIISKHCLWKRDLSDNSIHFFSSFDSDILFFFRCMEPFPNCSVSEYGCLIFPLLSFLCYPDSVCQLLGSFGGHFLFVDSVNWGILGPQTESLQLETQLLLFQSSLNIVYEKETCRTTVFTFSLLLTQTFCFFLDALSLFHIVPYRNLTVWFFICCLFLCYLNSVYQLLGSYRSLFLVPDSVKWAFLRPQTESLLLEPRGFLFPSSANLVCRRETCPEAIFTFFFFFWPTLFVF